VATRYFTADLHLGHQNIIRYCGRPFRDVDEMNAAIVERWNDTVADDDEVLVLGDFAMGQIDVNLPTARQLRGRKILLAGNHDRCWFGQDRNIERNTARYLDAGFSEVWQGAVAIDLGGVEVLLCHFPYYGDSQDSDRYVEYRPADHGGWLFHGHVHERWRVLDRMINVGVDVWDFRPVAEDVLTELITLGQAGGSESIEDSGPR
jgi:calcineurin-like phosphoesterase family protein